MAIIHYYALLSRDACYSSPCPENHESDPRLPSTLIRFELLWPRIHSHSLSFTPLEERSLQVSMLRERQYFRR